MLCSFTGQERLVTIRKEENKTNDVIKFDKEEKQVNPDIKMYHKYYDCRKTINIEVLCRC